MRRLKSLLPLAVLLSPGLVLVGLAQGQLTIDASKQPSPPARGRGPFPGSSSPGHSAHLPIRLEVYDWPQVAGGEPEILEIYSYINLVLNAGLDDKAFNY